MNDLIKTVLENRANAVEQMRSFVEERKDTLGRLSAEDQEQLERMQSEIANLTSRARELDKLAEENKAIDEQRARYESVIGANPDRPQSDDLNGRLRSWLLGETPGNEFRLGALPREYQVRHDSRYVPTLHEKRDLTVGNPSSSAMVPVTYSRTLYQHLIEEAAIRQTNARVITTGTGENIVVPKTQSFGTASWVGEGTALSENDPTFTTVTMSAWKVGQLLDISSELLQDNHFDVVGFVMEDMGRAIGQAAGAKYITGSGSNEPEGVVTAAGTGLTGGTGQSGEPTADELIQVFHSVISPYRRNSFWLMNDTSVSKIAQLKDTNNNYIWRQGLVAGEPDRLLGRPIVVDPNMSDPGTGLKSIAFGDFGRFFRIREVNDIRLERSTDFRFSSDMVTYRAVYRTDSKAVDLKGAVKLYRGGTA